MGKNQELEPKLKKAQASYKPGSVLDSHLSGLLVTKKLKRATFHHPPKADGLLLHQVGFTIPRHSWRERGVLLPHFSPLPLFRRVPLKWRSIVSVALSLFSRTVGITHYLLMVPGLSSRLRRATTSLTWTILSIVLFKWNVKDFFLIIQGLVD